MKASLFMDAFWEHGDEIFRSNVLVRMLGRVHDLRLLTGWSLVRIMSIARSLALTYGLVSLSVMLFVLAGSYEWTGIESHLMASIYALLLGMPWVLGIDALHADNVRIALAAIGVILNMLLILGIGWLVSRAWQR